MALVVQNQPADAGDMRDVGSILGSGRSPGEKNGNLLQYSCLENPMDRGAERAAVHESDTTEATELGMAWSVGGGAPNSVPMAHPPQSAPGHRVISVPHIPSPESHPMRAAGSDLRAQGPVTWIQPGCL